MVAQFGDDDVRCDLASTSGSQTNEYLSFSTVDTRAETVEHNRLLQIFNDV